MGSPAGRLLSLLERVQENPGLTAARLADQLGVSERTVRRYVTTLQDLGIPVEAGRGRYGGLRLRPGFRMPPLMLTTDEAVAVTLALAVMRGRGPDAHGSAETALAKLIRGPPTRGVQPGGGRPHRSQPTHGWLAGRRDARPGPAGDPGDGGCPTTALPAATPLGGRGKHGA